MEAKAELNPLVTFVTNANEGIASYRYRTRAPAAYLDAQGYAVAVSNKADAELPWVVFSKHWLYSDYNYAQFLKLRGHKVVFDICDDHFDTKHKAHYHRMLTVADVVVCNSTSMRKVLIENGVDRRKIRVIPDPVLTQPRPYNPEKALKLCWYGQPQNLPGLFEVYAQEPSFPILSALPGPVQAPDFMDKPYVEWTRWQPHVIQDMAEECSIALLPYRQTKNAKSANRVLEALNVGMPCITDLIPAVKDLGTNGIWDLREGFKEGVVYFSVDRSEEMASAQEMVRKEYSQEAIGKMWEEVLCG